MAEIDLQIGQPIHQAAFVAPGPATSVTVPMTGAVLSTAHQPAPLFFVWYSSLQGELDRAAAISPSLLVGTHVITFTAKDQDDAGVAQPDLKALYQSVTHIGAAGGAPPEVDSPCVIHVFAANMIEPAAGTANLSIANPVLEAQAPLQWANFDKGPPPMFVGMSPEYHALNKIRYRWLFRRVGDPPSATIELDLQGGNALSLLEGEASKPSRLHYNGSLPGSLISGADYLVTLRVEHADDVSIGHEVTRTVTLNA